ncbi:MAG: TIGR04283 family arsenosugar biosynthesis glycosyltransferase [Chitinophagaceae bacterium]
MEISVIIPTLNEAQYIRQCIRRLQSKSTALEILVVDGGSTDETVAIAKEEGAIVFEVSKKCRAFQMNFGAKMAQADMLYFVHGDALPPATFADDIEQASLEGFPMGRFRFRFDSPKLMLKINSWFTKFDKLWVSGGDETLFIEKELFERLGGYDEDFAIMEEYDLVLRAREIAPYKVIQKDVLVSARKYDQNSWLRVQKANLKAFKMFKNGVSSSEIRQTYYAMIQHPKQ